MSTILLSLFIFPQAERDMDKTKIYCCSQVGTLDTQHNKHTIHMNYFTISHVCTCYRAHPHTHIHKKKGQEVTGEG